MEAAQSGHELARDEGGKLLEDSITYDHIERRRLVQVISGENKYNFDVDVLYRYWYDNDLDVPLNPFDKQPLPRPIANKVLIYGELR